MNIIQEIELIFWLENLLPRVMIYFFCTFGKH
jgi:hypothetical protein